MTLPRATLALFLVLATCAAAQEKTPIQRRQEEMRKQFEQNYRGTRQLPGTHKMADLCRLRLEKGKWALASSAPEDARQGNTVRLDVDGLDGISILTISGRRDGTPDTFSFSHTSFSDPQAFQVQTAVTLNYGALTLNRYAQRLSGYESVQLVQGQALGQAHPLASQGVSFIVYIADEHGQMTQINHSAPDFMTLRRRHARDLDKYLRPMLRQLSLESIMAADPLTAWQVFADEAKPDPQVSARVRELLPALDSDKFQDREAAVAKLQALGLPMMLAVRHMDRSKLSDQQNTLLDTAVAPFRPEADAEAAKLKSDGEFLIDCLYGDDQEIRRLALARLKIKTGRNIEFDVSADFGARCAAIDRIRHGTAPATSPAH